MLNLSSPGGFKNCLASLSILGAKFFHSDGIDNLLL